MVKDDNGEPAIGMFRHRSIVGMLLYMCGHIRPYVDLDMDSYAWYMFSPKFPHELVLKILEHYLKFTKDSGLVLNLNPDVCKVDAYPYCDFYGIYGHEEPTDPACVKVHNGLSSNFLIVLFFIF